MFTYENGALKALFHKDQILGCQVHDQGNERWSKHGHGSADTHHLLLVHPASFKRHAASCQNS